MPRDAITPGSVIVFYDGVCGFCNGAVRFVAKRDRDDHFRFTPLQGPLARELLMSHDADPADLDSMYVLVDYGLPTERVYSRAGAILRTLTELGGVWALAGLLRLFPSALLDFAYDRFIQHRYTLFGKLDSCPIPDARERRKFVDIPTSDGK